MLLPGEVTRVAREVGHRGRLGGQANVPGVAGTEGSDRLGELDGGQPTAQVRNIAEVTTAVARGDCRARSPSDVKGEILELKDTHHPWWTSSTPCVGSDAVLPLESAPKARLGGQAQVPEVAGTWKDLTDNVNFNGVEPDRAGAPTSPRWRPRSPAATVQEDHRRRARRAAVAERGRCNTTTEQLRSFAAEVTRVAREVGTDGRLGGQAVVRALRTWKDLTDNINLLAANLTTQVRNIGRGLNTAVARGRSVSARSRRREGRNLELKNTINTMVDQLNAFASEVTRRCARSRHRRKARRSGQVPGVAGT